MLKYENMTAKWNTFICQQTVGRCLENTAVDLEGHILE